jgi:carboxypeptidase family protein
MVLRESGGVAARTTSASDGLYQFDALPDGGYRVDFETLSYDITRRNHVRVRRGETANVHVALYPSGVCECIAYVPPGRVQERAGQVLNESDQPLPHASLSIATPVRTEVAYADDEGRFQVRLPVEGTWPLTAVETGFGSLTLQVSGTGEGPIVFKLKRAGAPKVADVEQLSRGCRCAGDFFTHPGR